MDDKFNLIRKEYQLHALDEQQMHIDPIEQFRQWLQQAIDAGVYEPNGMTLATTGESGVPSARTVLLKGLDARGLVFYSNYNSRKGKEMEYNPRVALLLWWAQLERQIRIEGVVSKLTIAESDEYFQNRPRGSQLSTWVSQQSRVIAGRKVLEEQLQRLEQQYQNQIVPRPEYWGGYRVWPIMIEFWQGRVNRLHDRIRYRRVAERWIIERLAP